MKIYPTNLTDNQYATILRIIGDTRKRQRSLKGVFDAIFKQTLKTKRIHQQGLPLDPVFQTDPLLAPFSDPYQQKISNLSKR